MWSLCVAFDVLRQGGDEIVNIARQEIDSRRAIQSDLVEKLVADGHAYVGAVGPY